MVCGMAYIMPSECQGPFTQAIFVSNSMQLLSRRSCNFKIARVNHPARFRRDFSNLSQRYEIQLTKHGDFD